MAASNSCDQNQNESPEKTPQNEGSLAAPVPVLSLGLLFFSLGVGTFGIDILLRRSIRRHRVRVGSIV